VIRNLGDVDPTSAELYNDALRYVQLCLLADLRPPWVDHNFGTMEGTLSRYTKPSFLQWPAKFAATLFGVDVMDQVGRAATQHGLEIAGVVGRPLYVCTSRLHGDPNRLCMATAAMAPIMQLGAAREHYRCCKCKEAGTAPGSASAPVSEDDKPLRVLHLYVTVTASQDGQHTPVRTKPLAVVLQAPPDCFGWGKVPIDVDDGPAAVPSRLNVKSRSSGFNEAAYLFDSEASNAIWCSAAAFRSFPGTKL
jgi:hypothetical protein